MPSESRARLAWTNSCLVAAFVLLPQGTPPLTPGAPNATLDAEFTRVAAVRELPDGRVLVTDEADKRLVVGDWKTGGVRQIGREGSGPGEYQLPRSLFALAGDSTLLSDALAGRWLVLAGDSIVQTIPASAPPLVAGARVPLGADARGFVAATRPMGMPAANAPPSLPPRMDSSYLIRVNRRGGSSDTITTLAARPGRINVTGPVERPTRIEIVVNPLAVGDQAVVFPDGAIGIARVGPYRVDWFGADSVDRGQTRISTPRGGSDGRVVRGAALPFDRHPVTEREKRAILQRQATERGMEPRDPEAVPDWPATLPPFLVGGVLPAADGRMWIRRTAHAGDPRVHYDIVGRNGALVARLVLEEGVHVAGVSRTALYTVATDADGIQRLRRHALPAIRSN